jgi:hypothetical protein
MAGGWLVFDNAQSLWQGPAALYERGQRSAPHGGASGRAAAAIFISRTLKE